MAMPSGSDADKLLIRLPVPGTKKATASASQARAGKLRKCVSQLQPKALRLAAKVVEPPPRREPTPRKVQRQHLLPSSADPVYVEERRSLPCCAVCCTVCCIVCCTV